MKKLLFSLIAIVLLSNFSFGQEKYTVDYSKVIDAIHKIDAKDDHKIVTASEFSKELNGTIIVQGYQEKDVVKILSVKVKYASEESYKVALMDSSGCPNGYRACARGCNGNPTELGVILCIGYCMIDCY